MVPMKEPAPNTDNVIHLFFPSSVTTYAPFERREEERKIKILSRRSSNPFLPFLFLGTVCVSTVGVMWFLDLF